MTSKVSLYLSMSLWGRLWWAHLHYRSHITFPFVIHNTKLPYNLLSTGIVAAYLSVQISLHHNHIISIAGWNSVLQLAVHRSYHLLVHMLVPPSNFVLWVESCRNNPFANWRPFHQGFLCSSTHHDGYSSLLHLIISYVHHLLSTLQCYCSRPFPSGLTYP